MILAVTITGVLRVPIPTATSDLSSFYSAAGYYVPTSITMLSSIVLTRPHSAPSTATTQPTFAPSAPSRPRSTGLAEGSKVAIGLGVALGAILLGAVALYFFHKCRQNEVKAGNQTGHTAVCESRHQNLEDRTRLWRSRQREWNWMVSL